MTTKRKRRSFTKEFKEQIVLLHASGKPRGKIIKEFELTPSAIDKWVRQKKNLDHLRRNIIEHLNRESLSSFARIINNC